MNAYGTDTFLLLGSNLGNRSQNLASAIELIAKKCGPVAKSSLLYQTKPWGTSDQPEFYNQALQITTGQNPAELLDTILQIEHSLGRSRVIKWEPRLIDIDIIFYGTDVISTETLTIPHPLMAARRFVLAPLAELASDFIHPVLKKSVRELLNNCVDPLGVSIVSESGNAHIG